MQDMELPKLTYLYNPKRQRDVARQKYMERPVAYFPNIEKACSTQSLSWEGTKM
jgi:hypothetical protein